MNKHARTWIRPDREITPPEVWLDRRRILAGMAAAGLLPAIGAGQDPGRRQDLQGRGTTSRPSEEAPAQPVDPRRFRAPEGTYPAAHNAAYAVPERPLTPEDVAASYNNFYEFSENKRAVRVLSQRLDTAPWRVKVGGLCERPGEIDLEDFFAKLPSEERIYRFRCVEAWAMTVPWTGFPFAKFLEWVRPKPEAKYVRLVTFQRPEQAPGQRTARYPWPYYEALTLREAANELSLLAHGIYGHELPNQHGAPLRLVVPWKYGLKNIKSIVGIEFTAERPSTFWNDVAPAEYSWFSNVEPTVPHPRWSQAYERLIADGTRMKTLPYNGYADQVADLYKS